MRDVGRLMPLPQSRQSERGCNQVGVVSFNVLHHLYHDRSWVISDCGVLYQTDGFHLYVLYRHVVLHILVAAHGG